LSAKFCSDDKVKEVGIDQGGLDDRGMWVDFRRDRGYSYFYSIYTVLCPMDSGVSFPEAKRRGCEADRTSPFSAVVKNAWSYTSIFHYVFMAWRLIKHRDTYSLTHLQSFHISISPVI